MSRLLVESVAFGPLQQRVQRVGGVVYAPVQVTEFGEAGGHGGDGELARVYLVDFVPADGGRYDRFRHAAHRISAGDRVVASVLVVVDEEHGGVTVLAPPGGGDLVRRAAFDLAGEGVRGPPHLAEAPPRLDPHVDVQAVATRGLGPSGRSELAEDLVHDVGDPACGGEPGREPVHHARPLAQRAHDAVADRQVVPDQVEFGLPAGREVHPPRIGDPYRPVPDLNLHLICGHGRNLTGDEGAEHQVDVSLVRAVADHIRRHVGHLQVADIDAVQDDGTVPGLAVVAAQLLQLFGDVGDPPLGDPPYCGCRGRMAGVSEQGDLDAVGWAVFDGGRQELAQAFGWVRLTVQFFDHRLGAALLPHVQRRLDQGIPVLEVPVEAALGGPQISGDAFHGDGRDAAPGDHGQRGPGPVAGGKRTRTRLAHRHTVSYVAPYGTVRKQIPEHRGGLMKITNRHERILTAPPERI